MKYNLIVILGPTASGKTRLAARLAFDMGTEIISADSRQVYQGMDIGTGKDLNEYIIQGTTIPCHLINMLEPNEDFSVFEYQKRFFTCFTDISTRKLIPIMVGGTGLYIESVLNAYRMPAVSENLQLREDLEKYDLKALTVRLLELHPLMHNTTDLKDRTRLIRAIEIADHIRLHGHDTCISAPHIVPLVIGVRWERSILRRRITERLRQRLANGMIEEVKRLYDSGIPWERLDYFGLEYRYVGLYLQGIINYNDMFQKLNSRIHQFAKKQETWFRRMEKKGIDIYWINNGACEEARELISKRFHEN
jgi:tRNA dimethylallyltransferase